MTSNICIIIWSRSSLAPSHYMKQSLRTINVAFISTKLNQITDVFNWEHAFENIVSKMSAIWSRIQLINASRTKKGRKSKLVRETQISHRIVMTVCYTLLRCACIISPVWNHLKNSCCNIVPMSELYGRGKIGRYQTKPKYAKYVWTTRMICTTLCMKHKKRCFRRCTYSSDILIYIHLGSSAVKLSHGIHHAYMPIIHIPQDYFHHSFNFRPISMMS